MQAVHSQGLNTHDFVYILPWLQAEAKETQPWIGSDGQLQANIKTFFSNALIVDDVNGFDNTVVVTPFKERIESNGILVEELNLQNIYGYIHLYDSLKLYALAARAALNETGDPKILNDGKFIWNKMRKLTFPGLISLPTKSNVNNSRLISTAGISSGTVMMDDLAERAGIYAAFYVTPNRDEILKVVEMNPFALTNCDGVINRSGCFELNVVDLQTGFWQSLDGSLPSDEPQCGYRNERCDYTLMIIAGILVIAVLITIFLGYLIYRVLENRALAKTSWRIFRDDMRIMNDDEMRSVLSIGSTRTKLSNTSRFGKHHAVIGTNTHASFHMYPQKRPIIFAREDKQTLTMVCKLFL
uniref:Receptor ligand binding region domain-containing protein n=1 Tax=Panagrolaimus superbus TaxID=310955 RepID=A0A914YHR3_9BILA